MAFLSDALECSHYSLGVLTLHIAYPLASKDSCKLMIGQRSTSVDYDRNVLDAQQGTGTFIGEEQPRLSKKELETKLASICGQYLAMASIYGFSPEEVVQAIKKYGAK